MKNNFESRCAVCLIVSSLLMVITMVLHPAGGSIEHLIKISSFIIATHSIALFSIPLALLGFWGLSKRLDTDNILTSGAFITMCVGIFAVLCAAATNGLALPLFLNHYADAPPEKIALIKPVVNYNAALNHAFDLIYIGASCIAIAAWSIVILQTGRLPKWLGWFGIILAIIAVASMVAGFVFVDLAGFRIFIVGFVAWTISTGFLMRTKNNKL